MKRVLVAGGAGFLGAYLCERLLERGYKVICLDNLITGRIENIQHLNKDEHFEFVDHDITLPYYAEVDQIYNLACTASPLHYQADPVYTMKTNVLGAINLLDLAKTNNARILQASTSEIY